MNKRQKLVQQRFLDNEDKIIAELKKTYKQSQRDIELKTYALQSRINDLQARIDAESDEERKKVLKSMQQAKIYQKNYQDALKKQIDGILDNMHVEEFKSISDYLNKCYEDGFLGTMYDLHGQDIPLIFPIDQEAMVRAVQLDSKISEGLYKRLGEDVEQLKKDIASEVSRGISTGASFEQIGQQIGFKMMGKYDAPGGALAKAMTIARTEGHRIQVQSTMDACYKAKEIGADVVKQWDSTLDGKTRGAHKKVDGEVRELDEPFSNGLMYPGDPNGGAKEVVNCRCALLQRARWAMGEEELETLKKRAEYFGLNKEKSFDGFKKKYADALSEMQNINNTKKSVERANKQATAAIKEAYERRRVEGGLNFVPVEQAQAEADFTGMDGELAQSAAEQFATLAKKYETSCQGIEVGEIDMPGVPAHVERNNIIANSKLKFNKSIVNDKGKYLERMQSAVDRNQFPRIAEKDYDKYVVTHEFFHTLMDFDTDLKNYVNADTRHISKARKEIRAIRSRYMEDIRELAAKAREVEGKAIFTLDETIWKEAQELQNELRDKKISKYADASIDEFAAEAFADAILGVNPSKYSQEVLKVVDKYFKKG